MSFRAENLRIQGLRDFGFTIVNIVVFQHMRILQSNSGILRCPRDTWIWEVPTEACLGYFFESRPYVPKKGLHLNLLSP